MRNLSLGVMACVLLGSSVYAQTPDPQIAAPISTFIESFNKGDAAAAAATHASGADLTILDEVPPYLWRGPKAFDTWAADLAADATKRGISDQRVTISAPTRVETDATNAYVVVPAVYTFNERGVAKRGEAQMAFVLKRAAGGWLIHGWAWTGPKI